MKKLLISSDSSVTFYTPKENRLADHLPELASIRRRRGITLEQIANATKISIRYLYAIEEGRLGKLPGGVYTSNYLRQYAEACRHASATS